MQKKLKKQEIQKVATIEDVILSSYITNFE
jgi:hypothetical protein